MFKWYQNAAICYAHLGDVTAEDYASVDRLPSTFPNSRWFTRGWTLQELLAPSAIVFYSVDWVSIGNRRDLARTIAEITQIDLRFFESGNFDDFSIAQRMSWASQRQTTRVEDQAYCLLGLFGVNMPLLYGEGEQAFVRLQQEIMKESDDQTIFAWGPSDLIPLSGSKLELNGGILAPSPKSFAGSGYIVRSQTDGTYGPYVATNKGLQISLPLLRADTATSTLITSRSVDGSIIPSLTLTTASHGSIAVLNCQPFGENEKRIGLYVEKQLESGSYVRANYQNGIALISLKEAKGKATQTDLLIQIQNKIAQTLTTQIYQSNRPVLIQPLKMLGSEFKLSRTCPKEAWQHQPTGSLSSTVLDFPSAALPQKPCALEYTDSSGYVFVLILHKQFSLMRVTGLEACIIENEKMAKDEAGLKEQVRDAIYKSQAHSLRLGQMSSHGLLNIVPKITEARHASILNLEVRKATSSIPKIKLPSSLGPPPSTVVENITISVTPPDED
ncbi:hypothetical protein E0Z10_g7243 [Xylaria hypoxylon]|uniref:DUF8212 domain-containing protein n=1 Tax=Xylaria hypoxylon TaxID=37992 RepID=A0A4Z0YSV0_9PEZI|nr:hypothetical protein E0Z10_g7243 [Xylaria hypoxylon]